MQERLIEIYQLYLELATCNITIIVSLIKDIYFPTSPQVSANWRLELQAAVAVVLLEEK